MQLGGVAAGAFVAGRDLLVGGGEQRAGAAGEIAHAQLADAFGVGPVEALQLGDREPGQQRRRGGPGVEGGQILAVGDQALEDASGEVVGVVAAGRVHLLGGVAQFVEQLPGRARRQPLEDVAGDREDGEVVDFEDFVPGRRGLVLGIGDAGAADLHQRLNARVHAGNALVEDERVGDDRAGHAPGLGHVAHAEQVGDGGDDVHLRLAQRVEHDGGPLDPALERVGGLVDLLLRHGDEPDQVGEVVESAVEPARGGEADTLAVSVEVVVEHAVGELRVAER